MVQIIPMERTPSPFQSLGAGLGQGLSQGINYGIQDMLQQKSNSRQIKSLFAMLGPEVTKSLGLSDADIDKFSGLDPKLFMSVIDAKRQQMSLDDLIRERTKSPLNNQYPEESTQEGTPTSRTLAPGIAPMLEYQDIPAEETAPPGKKTRQETPVTPKKSLSQELKDNKEYWNNRIMSAPRNMVKEYIQMMKEDQFSIRDQAKAEAAQEKNALAREKYTTEQGQKITDYNLKQIEPLIEEIGIREQKNNALKLQLPQARQAVESGNTAGIGQFLAAKGFSPGLTPESALLKYLSKENIANVVDRIGGRANMFLEKVASTASAAPGHDRETALGLIEFEESEMRQDEKKAEIANRLAQKYANSKKKMYPGQFQKEINKELTKWIPKNVDYTSYKIQQSRESGLTSAQLLERAFDKATAPGYTPITRERMAAIKYKLNGDDRAAAKKALELGYVFPKYIEEPK